MGICGTEIHPKWATLKVLLRKELEFLLPIGAEFINSKFSRTVW
jgi:hypothetical protein